MDETNTISVTINSVANKYIESIGATVFEVLTDQGKFSFFQNKKDGNETKAYQQFQTFKFRSGDTVEVAYTEREGSKYQNKKTLEWVTPINKTIVYFILQDENTPKAPPQRPPVNNDIAGEIKELRGRIEILEEFNGIAQTDESNPGF